MPRSASRACPHASAEVWDALLAKWIDARLPVHALNLATEHGRCRSCRRHVQRSRLGNVWSMWGLSPAPLR